MWNFGAHLPPLSNKLFIIQMENRVTALLGPLRSPVNWTPVKCHTESSLPGASMCLGHISVSLRLSHHTAIVCLHIQINQKVLVGREKILVIFAFPASHTQFMFVEWLNEQKNCFWWSLAILREIKLFQIII